MSNSQSKMNVMCSFKMKRGDLMSMIHNNSIAGYDNNEIMADLQMQNVIEEMFLDKNKPYKF